MVLQELRYIVKEEHGDLLVQPELRNWVGACLTMIQSWSTGFWRRCQQRVLPYAIRLLLICSSAKAHGSSAWMPCPMIPRGASTAPIRCKALP